MNRVFAIALCAFFTLHAAEARTLYVDASRPNNKGNGLSAKKAKKTIQAAINIAKKGDTILVYPGHYAPIKTNNKKITIKSVKGKDCTDITVMSGIVNSYDYLADLAPWREDGHQSEVGWIPTLLTIRSGHATKLIGFLLHGDSFAGAVAGGTVSKCEIADIGRGDSYCHYMVRHSYSRTSSSKTTQTWAVPTIDHANLTDCAIHSCDPAAYVKSDSASGIGICQSKLVRCRIQACNSEKIPFRIHDTDFRNCLFAETPRIAADESSFVNCTIVRNSAFKATKSTFRNCIVYKSGTKPFKKSAKNKFSTTFKDNRDPCFVSLSEGEYHLSAQSPCIDSGKNVSGTGTKDLGCDRRIRRKSIDRGCFEYHDKQKIEVSFYTTGNLDGRDGVDPIFDGDSGHVCYGIHENNPEFGNFTWAVKTYAGSSTYGSLPEPKLDWHIFAGWWTDPVGGRLVSLDEPISCFRLFAHWIEVRDGAADDVNTIFRNRNTSKTSCGISFQLASIQIGQEIADQMAEGFDLVVPDRFHGIPVTALLGLWKLSPSSITIPRSVTAIQYDLFSNCPKLKTIRLQEGSPLAYDPEARTLGGAGIPKGCTVVRDQ